MKLLHEFFDIRVNYVFVYEIFPKLKHISSIFGNITA
jgi:hypothetical protein